MRKKEITNDPVATKENSSFFKPKELDTLQVQVQVMEADSVLTLC